MNFFIYTWNIYLKVLNRLWYYQSLCIDGYNASINMLRFALTELTFILYDSYNRSGDWISSCLLHLSLRSNLELELFISLPEFSCQNFVRSFTLSTTYLISVSNDNLVLPGRWYRPIVDISALPLTGEGPDSWSWLLCRCWCEW